jgi:hypothetical protein
MQGGDAVDAVRADEGEMGHAHAPAVVLVDERQFGEVGMAGYARRGVEEDGVDAEDDLHVARQQPLHQRHRPGLQRLRQERVVGVGDAAARHLEGLVPGKAVVVHQEAHEFGDGEGGMGVVELDRRAAVQRAQVLAVADMAQDEVLQRGGGEEILLPQPELLALGGRIVRVEDAGDGLGPHAFRHGTGEVAAVECLEEQRLQGAGAEEPQRRRRLAAPADHRHVIADRQDPLGGDPAGGVALALFHPPAEADLVGAVAALELPRIAEGEPVLRTLHLLALLDGLAEEAVFVADAVADGRHAEGRHGFHVAGGEAAEGRHCRGRRPAPASPARRETGRTREHVAQGLAQAEIAEGIVERAADEEFERQVVDALADRGGGRAPGIDHRVAHGEDGGSEPVVIGGVLRQAADGIAQLAEQGLSQGGAGRRLVHDETFSRARAIPLPEPLTALRCGRVGRQPAPDTTRLQRPRSQARNSGAAWRTVRARWSAVVRAQPRVR